MNKLIGLFMALVSLCTFNACTKDTFVSGTITDQATGLPLEGVEISFTAYKFFMRNDDFSMDRRVIDTHRAVTGPEGRYSFKLETPRPDAIEFVAKKDGYNYENRHVDFGAAETIDLAMNPVDAVLKVKVINESGVVDNIYAVVNTRSELPAYYFQPWPFLLNQGESFTQTFKINGGQTVEIRWGNDENEPIKLYNGVRRDSVFCPRGGTTEYVLKL